MPEATVIKIADAADLIVNGYAFTRAGDNVRVLNLRTGKAAVLNGAGVVLETSMDDMDMELAVKYFAENRRFMECAVA